MSNTLLYVITVLIWGSTWLAIEFQLGTVEPEASIVYRYALASLMLFGWSYARGLRLRFNGRAHAWFMLLGALLFSLNYVLAYRAQVHLTSAMCALAFTAMVWMNILLSRLIFGTRIDRRVVVGATLGIAGIVILFAPRIGNVTLNDSIFIGSLLALGSALVASAGNMVSQKAQLESLPVIQSNAWSMFYGMLLTTTYVLLSGREFAFDPSASYVLSLLYLSLFGSVIAFGAYLTLLGRIGAHRAGYAVVMFPVVALILSMLFEGLVLDLPVLFGTLLVLTGNVFVLKGVARRRRLDQVPARAATSE